MSDSSWSVQSDLTATDNISPVLQRVIASLAQGQAALDRFGASAKALGGSSADVSKLDASFRALNATLTTTQSQATSAAAALSSISPAANNSANALRQHGTASRGAGASAMEAREAIVLLHEAMSGRFSRIPGSLLVMSEFMGGLTTKTLAWGAAIGVPLLVLGELAYQGEKTAEAIGNIQAAMDGLGKGGGGGGSQQILDIVGQLKTLPTVTTGVAEEMTTSMARARDVGVEQFQALGTAAVGFSRVTGETVPKALQTLVGALDGNGSGLKKLDEEWNIFGDGVLSNIEALEAAGQKTEAAGIAIQALQQKFGPLISDGLTPAEIQLKNLSNAWDEMTGNLSDGKGWSQAIANMESFAATAMRVAGLVVQIGQHPVGESFAPAAQPAGGAPAPAVPQATAPGAQSQQQLEQQAKTLREQESTIASILKYKQEQKDSDATITALEAAQAAGVAGATEALAVAQEQATKIHSQAQQDAYEQLKGNLQSELILAKDNASQRIQLAKQIASVESAYHGPKSNEAREANNQVAREQQNAVDKGAAAQKKADEEHKKALEEQLRLLEEAAGKQPRGSQGRVDAATSAAGFATANFGAGSSQAKSAISDENSALEEQLSLKREIAQSDTSADTDITKMQLAAQKDALQQEVDARQVSTAQQIALLKSLTTASTDADLAQLQAEQKDLEAGTKAFEDNVNEQRKMREQLALDLVKIDTDAANKVKAAWDEVNKGIADQLSSALTDAISGKKGGLQDALRKMVLDSIGGLTKDVGTGLMQQLEGALGLGGSSPGSLLSGLLGKVGLGGVGSFLGIGGAVSTPATAAIADPISAAAFGGTSVANTAADTTLLTAATTLTPAGPALTASAGALTAAAGALTAAATASGIGGAAGGAGGIGSLFGQVGSAATLFAFADGGSPPVGAASIVGERGPELFTPGVTGQITSNDNLRRALGDNGNVSPIGYSPSVTAGGWQERAMANARTQFGDVTGGDTIHSSFHQETHVHGVSDPMDAAEMIRKHGKKGAQQQVRQLANRRR